MNPNIDGEHDLLNLPNDRVFWIAVLAGPAFWFGLDRISPLEFDLQKIIDQWLQYLLLVGVYPILEEWVFRGVLQPQLHRYPMGRAAFCGISGANALTTLLFVILHFFAHPPVWALLVSVPSLIFGVFRDRYQSVIPPILLHCFYNLGYFALFQVG